MKFCRPLSIILLSFTLILPIALIIHAQQPATVFAGPAQSASLLSRVVCAPDSHSHCQPGPYTETYSVSEPVWIVVDVYLVHTGSYESNESSHFYSPFGDLLDCGPLQPGEDERYCGQVVGWVDDSVEFTIRHAGYGLETGSHQQRYDIKLCDEEIYFPAIFKRVP